MSRTREMLTSWLVLVVVSLSFLAGCQTTPSVGSDPDEPSEESIEEHPPTDRADTSPMPTPHVRVGVMTATAAAEQIRSLPPLDETAKREIALYRTLYQAAWETNVGGHRGHYLLDPPADPPGLWAPGEFDLALEAFQLYVIAGFAEFQARFAWTPAWAAERWSEPAYFPGTNRLATRLKVRILDRDDEGGTVRAEISDGTAHTGGSRQRLTARWRDGQWEVERDRVRVVW